MELALVPLLGRCSHLFFILLLTFFILYLTITRISPGVFHLREPSVARPFLQLSPANTFSIVVFSDLHFGEEEDGWGEEQDNKTLRVMNSVLNDELVDLVILDGDLITGENTHLENSTDYLDRIVRPMVSHARPWASTYGNHDSQFNLSREALFRAESGYSMCYTTRMDKSLPGITNYYLVIKRYDDDTPAAILWFLDSRGGNEYQQEDTEIPGLVAPETSEWFKKTHDSLKKKYRRALPSLAFVHIPPRVFLDSQASLDPQMFPGLNDDVPVSIQSGDDSAFVDALLHTEGLHSIYVGHDHGNSWCSPWPGSGIGSPAPFLCFSKHTGYGGYGDWKRGARVLSLNFSGSSKGNEMTVETWIRMEDGRVVQSVSLNSTYGSDEYPPDTGE